MNLVVPFIVDDSNLQGVMETFAGLGYTAGPPIGGVLYELGGFQLPFLVLGAFLIIAAVLSYFLIEDFDGSSFDFYSFLKNSAKKFT